MRRKTMWYPTQYQRTTFGLQSTNNVYSAIVRNKTDRPVVCIAMYSLFDDKDIYRGPDYYEVAQAIIHPNGAAYFSQKTSNGHTKKITRISVQKWDGTTLVLNQPFKGVTGSVNNWHFYVHDSQILSRNPLHTTIQVPLHRTTGHI
ncbi:unnamed protein product [Didymodactylos carnosus]|uniref:Uncharacterized protein n=1 Tax=Didymodactylos carnosus TaxID=1234261 RepID=A0A814M564_9BILA|nr:unnamed protein product [Didymodactylos carnosus]CAF1148347.1 unnamed protein product [Didymodactylos carnosus]CAF3841390.1 unnamed protein product [Didymodactylos carnosus]CAF3952069.1 unnamed protein product [Didymodactylos carnosus]